MNNFKNNNRRSRFKPNGDRGFRRNGNGNKPNGDFGNGSAFKRRHPGKNNQNPTETKHNNPYHLKSSRDHEHLPKQTEPQLNRQIAMKFMQTRPDPLTQRIDHRITILNTQTARFGQLHKQLHITQNNQHLI